MVPNMKSTYGNPLLNDNGITHHFVGCCALAVNSNIIKRLSNAPIAKKSNYAVFS